MINSMVYLSALGVWFVFLVIAFGVGAVREGLLRPRIGEPKAHVIGTLIAVALMMLVIYAFIRRLHKSRSILDLILIGVISLFMTVAFEFGFFHFVMGKPWEALAGRLQRPAGADLGARAGHSPARANHRRHARE